MPRLQQPSQRRAESTPGMNERMGLATLGKLNQCPQITPAPHGPESLELSRILARLLRSLEELETMRPYIGSIPNPYLALLGHSAQSDESSLDYQSPPPARTVTMNARFVVRGRGKPKPHPLEDD